MSTSSSPSDAELLALYQKIKKARSKDPWVIAFARAVLARWAAACSSAASDEPFLVDALVDFNGECWRVIDYSDAHAPEYSYWLMRPTTEHKYPVPVTHTWLKAWQAASSAVRHERVPAASASASKAG